MVIRHHEEQKQKEERAKREEQAKLRRIASSIAKEVKQFWSNVEKVYGAPVLQHGCSTQAFLVWAVRTWEHWSCPSSLISSANILCISGITCLVIIGLHVQRLCTRTVLFFYSGSGLLRSPVCFTPSYFVYHILL